MGVDRKPYYGKCFIGNACHTVLKPNNITKLCSKIPDIIGEETSDPLLLEKVKEQCQKFSMLFSKYGACDAVFNSSGLLTDQSISMLEESFNEFMFYFRINWPKERIIPKMHILECHVIEFVTKWRMGCGFMVNGEVKQFTKNSTK